MNQVLIILMLLIMKDVKPVDIKDKGTVFKPVL